MPIQKDPIDVKKLTYPAMDTNMRNVLQVLSDVQKASITVTDWVAYTPTFAGAGTPTVNTAYWKQIDNTIYVRGFIDFGTTTASNMSITLPNGTLINTNKILAQTVLMGFARAALAAVGPTVQTLNNMLNIFYDGTDTAKVYLTDRSGNQGFTKVNTNAYFSANDTLSYQFDYPI